MGEEKRNVSEPQAVSRALPSQGRGIEIEEATPVGLTEETARALANLHAAKERIRKRIAYIDAEARERIAYARNELGSGLNAIRQSMEGDIPWDRDYMVLSGLEYLGNNLRGEAKVLNELYTEKKKLNCVLNLLEKGTEEENEDGD